MRRKRGEERKKTDETRRAEMEDAYEKKEENNS